MKLRRAFWVWCSVSAMVLACSSGGGSNSGNCCDIGSGSQGVPACLCGSTTSDAGTCKIVSTVGETCTVSCNGMTAGGQTTNSCTEQ